MQSELPDERSTAARAVFAIYTGSDAALIADTIRHLLPHRQALQSTLDAFMRVLYIGRRRLLPTTRSILAVLAEDPLTLAWHLQLLFWGLPWPEAIEELIRLGPQLHADALISVEGLINQIKQRPGLKGKPGTYAGIVVFLVAFSLCQKMWRPGLPQLPYPLSGNSREIAPSSSR